MEDKSFDKYRKAEEMHIKSRQNRQAALDAAIMVLTIVSAIGAVLQLAGLLE